MYRLLTFYKALGPSSLVAFFRDSEYLMLFSIVLAMCDIQKISSTKNA
jgi:hypothetical protein